MNAKTDGYTSASAQMDVIEAWKAKNGMHGARVKKLDSKIGAQKKRAAAETKKRQWVSDRDSLQREQNRYEDDLRALYSSCLDSELHAYLVSLEDARVQLAVTIENRLRDTKGAIRACSSREAASAAAQELRQYLASEEVRLAKEATSEDDLSTAGPGEMRATDLNAIFREYEDRLGTLAADSSGGSDDLYDTLSGALTFARERAMARAGSPPVTQSTVAPDVMSTAVLLLKMADRGRHDNLQYGTNASLVDRLRTSCPQLTHREAQRLVEDAKEWRLYVQNCRAAAVDYRKAAQSVLALYTNTVSTNSRVEAMTKEKERIGNANEERQKELHARAQAQRELYDAKAHARAAQERAEQEKEAALLAKAKEQRMREMQLRMDCLAVYLQKRQELAEEEARQAALQRAQQEAERRERQRHDGARVAFRQNEYADRQETKKQQMREVERLREEKQAALDRFFRAVDERIGVEANPDRLLLATVASSQASKEPAAVGAAFSVVHGYSDEQIMKDPRVKLYAALMEAGLHKTEYGREVATRGFRVSPAQQTSEMNPLRGEY